MKRKWTKLLVDGADLPGEGLPGQPVLELYGQERVLMENHGGILEYGPERIRAKVNFGSICVCGSDLHLCRMQGRQLVIMGKIEGISLERRKG